MHAWRVHSYGDYRQALTWEECDAPSPPDAGVVIDVAAAGVNFPDILAIAGQYQIKAPLPFVPGIEAVGRVAEAGPKSQFKAGERIIASNLCGAFGERMLAPDQGCFRVPDEMSDEHAAALLITYQTGYFGLVHRCQLGAGETLLVHGGAGGVGTAAIQLGKALGATVIATAGSAAKLDVCRQTGADHVINYRDQDFVAEVKKLTSGRGADVIYDPVGGDVFDHSTRCIAVGGRLLVIGFASGRIPEIRANRILLKNISIVGLNWGNYQFIDQPLIRATHDALCGLYAEGKIAPVVSRTYGLRDLPDALDAIRDRTSHGKLVVTSN
ncbi:MAG: NADPH:quinone oxidoreductase family protein [Haliangiales bacterium]